MGHAVFGPMVTTRGAKVSIEGDDTIVVTVRGRLDAAAAVELEAVVLDQVALGPRGLDIDLREVTDWSEAGADGLVRCHRLAAQLADGLRYRTGRGPGHEALLAAYANLA
jgi:anti-anti-sigma regulatory factor